MTERELYTLLDASNIEDILRHFPSRYEDLTVTPVSAPYVDSKRYVVKGTIKNLRSFSRNGSFIHFYMHSFSGEVIPCVIYNQPFYMNVLSSDCEKLIVAYYKENRKSFIVSSVISLDSYAAQTGIKPCYSLPKGVSPSFFTNCLKKILSNENNRTKLFDKVPEKYKNKYKLIDAFDAYKMIHFPKDHVQKNEGLRVFKYQEALAYVSKAMILKKENEKRKKIVLDIDVQKGKEFISSLPFKLTEGQRKAVNQIYKDMVSKKAMYRLLQGDVGSGKTAVAFISLYFNYLRGKQGVLLSPTFELSKQHYQNAIKIFSSFSVKVELITGQMKASRRKEIISEIKQGKIDIVIATTSIISDDFTFADLGLTIIDEQQLFGVKQREKLLLKCSTSDLLMMSATPIPRSMSQIINYDLDVSSIEDSPFGKRLVKTEVVRSSDPLISAAINKCISRDRQVFVVVPKIEENNRSTKSTEEVYREYKLRYKEENVACLNGRIKKEEREKIFDDFTSKKKKILVSTTVIEVGVDVKEAGLLIIYDSNCFGLSSLHQLRGRIGRTGDFSLCLLIYDGIDEEVKEKLNFLKEHDDGYSVSLYDLKNRGSGSYQGEKQSGKSELLVCNFVDDRAVFTCAREDAEEILNNLDKKENKEYISSLYLNNKPHLV